MGVPMGLNVRFVLVRPRNAENLGSAARALKNFGLSQWTWVDAKAPSIEPAYKLAVHAEELLDSVRRETTLAAAVADCSWVVGTSSRHVRGKRRLGPRELAREAVDRARAGTVAIVFGDERSGLSNEEVDQCHDLSAIPTDDAQPSVNLAQATLLYAYELRLARLEAAESNPAPLPVPAPDAQLRAIEQALTSALTRSRFLSSEGRHAVRDLMATLRRSRLSKAEAGVWSAALHVLARALPEDENGS